MSAAGDHRSRSADDGRGAAADGGARSGAGRPVVVLLSGPNLDLLGERQPEVYGTETLADHVGAARQEAERSGFDLEHHQTNHEGELIELVHAARGRAAALIVNAGALSHTSWSLHDALAAFDGPVVELHLSNPAARESWRHRSVLAPVATGSIAGFGGLGYRLAVEAVSRVLPGARRAERTP